MTYRWAFCLLAVVAIGACAPAWSSTDPSQLQVQLQPDPTLRPGDILRITVWRQPEFSGEFYITADSSLAHPLYQTVRVGGVALSVVRHRLEDFLTTYVQDPQIVVEPLLPVTVGGEVSAPSLYRLPRETTIAQAVAQAGGATPLGRLDQVRVVRGDRVAMVDLTDVRSPYPEIPIVSGDQIFVTQRSTFNFWTGILGPITTLIGTAASIAVLARL